MKPFNLEEYLNEPSRRLTTREGGESRIRSVDIENVQYPITATVDMGLLYWNGKKIIHIKGAPKHENTARADMMILSSILRRENFPAKIYNYRHQNTTIKPQIVLNLKE